jgi:predicted CoA-substrate-specific enzyme activase
MKTATYNVGLDVGSTTIKLVFIDEYGELAFTRYRRHHADIAGVLNDMLTEALLKKGNCEIKLVITGSAGMGLAEKYNLPFVQEVVASAEVIAAKYPDIKTLVDIGGEDTKMVFFAENHAPDIRMNGSCAGGTGAFIDQMATLLGIEVADMSKLALDSINIYPIASRCGVFSKTDVQNLLARNVNRSDIAASVFHAVALQTITTLARGNDIKPMVFFCGGPLAFIPALRDSFISLLHLNPGEYVVPENAEMVPALGSAIIELPNTKTFSIENFINRLSEKNNYNDRHLQKRLAPLFKNEEELEIWKLQKRQHFVDNVNIEDITDGRCFLGIDSGSTTTKIVAIDHSERVIFRHYAKNNGNPLETVAAGLSEFQKQAEKAGKEIIIEGSSVTGYGEDLVKASFNLDYGIVETIAHYTAAHKFSPNLTFILDIGGQDMKAIFVENGAINRLEINEACSSGCGSFIEGFAGSLKYSVADFANQACTAQAPCDLGTRCTVFMNSKVKQFLREGASVADIASGLAYSVVKNCIYKVLKLKDISELGGHIVVQGGTMRNLSVVRALELLIGKEVLFTDMPELMGAYGAALYARRLDVLNEAKVSSVKLKQLSTLGEYSTEQFNCTGCENKCVINEFGFNNGNNFYSGNKCEKIYTNKGGDFKNGENHYNYKYNLLVNRPKPSVGQSMGTIGIPRVLNLYENLPFWHSLLSECGFKVVLSGRSTNTLYEKGLGTVMSDNICFPAKLVHGHIFDLVSKKVDRILMPYVVFESKEDKNSANSYNCPIVSGYSDVIKSAINTLEKYNIPIDSPTITFSDPELLKKACIEYLKSMGISKKQIEKAFDIAIKSQIEYTIGLTENTKKILNASIKENRMVIMLAGRPYHSDPLVQHKISDMVSAFGVDVISEDLVRSDAEAQFINVNAVTQWAYTNRIIKAAQWVANSNLNIHFVQMTSFGCGPDAFIVDEVSDILKQKGKNLTLLKIDDVNNIGSLKLRIRSLIESLKFSAINKKIISIEEKHTPLFEKIDQKRTILVPYFSEYYSPFVPVLFKLAGYKFENLPPSDEMAAELGLKFANNEICFPATLIVGDVIKALKSGKYKSSEIAIAISQTGGQCRATNYISLIKKAMLNAGFDDIPVISLASGDAIINNQPGFKVKWRKVIRITAYAMLYADTISKMYYSTVVREKVKGGAGLLRDKYINDALPFTANKNVKGLLALLKQAVSEFNEMAISNNVVPRIGIVGEIYVKYNAFGNKNIVNWLIGQKVEVVVPALVNFFLQFFANYKINIKQNLEKPSYMEYVTDILFKLVDKYIQKVDAVASGFKYHRPFSNIYTDAENASQTVNLAAQFGEGWLIPAEIANFSEEGVFNTVSLQPFGCIANHVISKGVEKRLKTLYPSMNLLFLDFDGGTSEVNILNRLHFMIKNAEEVALLENVKSSENLASHYKSNAKEFVKV